MSGKPIDEAVVIARELACMDGFDPDDQHGGLYDLRLQGGSCPEPLGDAWSMDYLPRGERIASALRAAQQRATLVNPHTGEPRDWRDVNSDPAGVLCVKPGAPLLAAQQQGQAVAWVREWQGSGPQRGFHIREATRLHNNRVIAYLGDQADSTQVDRLIEAHNRCVAPAPSVTQDEIDEFNRAIQRTGPDAAMREAKS